MITTMETQAQAVADRVDPVVMGMDPGSIFLLISQILPFLISCWNRNDEPNPSLAAASFKRYHASQPKKLRLRTARRVRSDADEPMTRKQSFVVADAVIAQALATEENVAAACAHEVGKDLYNSED